MFRGRRRPKAEHVRAVEFALRGGEDLVTPAMSIHDGMLIYSNNYEAAKGGGYARIEGYERFSGRAKPSEVVIYGIPFDAGSVEPVAGGTVVGGTSNARGIVSGVELLSGSWVGSDAAGYISVRIVNGGVFIDNEDLVDAPDSFSVGFEHDGFQ